MTLPLLDIRGLDVAFKDHHAVRGLDLHIHRGETVALVGESGCGKSTTALSLLKLLPRTAHVSGQALFDGQNLLDLDDTALSRIRGNRIAMIFQEPMTSLNPVLTIGDQVGESLRLHRELSSGAARRRAIELLDLVNVPEPQRRVDDYPHRLSGGQRQRVMIAAAIACDPVLLIADEPTTALDVTVQAQILALLDRLRREMGLGVLLITHDLGVVADWADRVAVMYGGRILEQADAAAFSTLAEHPYSRGLLGASLSLSDGVHYRTKRLPEVRVASENHGASPRFDLVTRPAAIYERPASSARIAAAGATTIPHPTPSILSVTDLVVNYTTAAGTFPAVRSTSFAIARGETLGLVGESGCGKSTLSKAIMRLIEPAGGRIELDGENITHLPRSALKPHRARMQMIFQDPYASLNPRQTLDDILDFALSVHGNVDRAERQRRIKQIVDDVGLPQSARTRYPNEFLGGQRQRIGIARALVLRPSLLICDEPVSALDVSVQAQILNLIVDLKRAFNLSLLFISHDLSVVHYIADRIMVMQGGRIIETGTHATLWRNPQAAYTRTLIDAVPGKRRAVPLTPVPQYGTGIV